MTTPLRAFALLALSAATAFPQAWDSLSGLKPGDAIVVMDSAGNDHKGQFRSYTADTIRVTTGKSEQAIERTRVRRVQLRTGSRRVRNVLIGAGIGFALGITIDHTLGAYLRNEAGESDGARALTYVAPIGIFSAIGAALPSYRTVYRAP
jgi:hypothetical protein